MELLEYSVTSIERKELENLANLSGLFKINTLCN